MKIHILSVAFCSIIITTALLVTHAEAQSVAPPDELQAIYACKSISSAQERLACYDNSVGRFEEAEKSGEVVTVSKTAIENVEREAFGFNLPSLPSLGRIFGGNSTSNDKPKKVEKENDLTAPVKQAERVTSPPSSLKPPALTPPPEPKETKEVSLDIRKTTEFGYNKTRFFMTNGQVWEQTDRTNVRIPKVRDGKTNNAEISKASLGSFFLRVNGKGSAIRVRRVR